MDGHFDGMGRVVPLLLDFYLKTVNEGMERRQAIKECSEALRQMALNNGIAIDETYRNTK